MGNSRYILFLLGVLLCAASCVGSDVMEPEKVTMHDAGIMTPSLKGQMQKPAYATRALSDAASNNVMDANFLRLNEDISGTDGLDTYHKSWDQVPSDGEINWEKAYLLEASSISAPDGDGRRSVLLNPVQTYYTRKLQDDTYLYYKSLMVSWSPRTCILHKNSDGATAVITELETFQNQNVLDVYEKSGDEGRVSIKFRDLDGNTDVMVSNAVEAMQWHEDDGSDRYRLPFGHNDASPSYDNPITYRHYLSAIRLHAYSEHSEQMAQMWGKILDVVIKNQPSECSVTLPYTNPVEMPAASGLYSSQPGEAVFSGNTEFSIHKDMMYGENSGMPDDRPADLEPSLDGRNSAGSSAYLGYALIQPSSSVVLEVHTETGVYELTLSSMSDQNGNAISDFSFEAGYIYDVYMNFQTYGTISALLLNDGIYRYYDLTNNTLYQIGDDHAEEYHTANCYVIHPGIKTDGGQYYDGFAFLATVAGNGDGGVLAGFDRKDAVLKPKKAALLWESSYGLISQVELMYGYVRFRTQKPDSGQYKEGNAVIAVYDNDFNVLWSWHIWITDEPQAIAFNEDITIMDRNLGAVASSTSDGSLLDTYGLYYQWGRKDPFMGPPDDNYLPQSTATATYYDAYAHDLNSVDVHMVARPTIADGVTYPMYMLLPVELSPYYQYDWLYSQENNLWGHDFANGLIQKTIYDPCPTGYRTPAESMNVIASTTTGRSVEQNGVTYTVGGKQLFFPYAGYKGVDRGMSSMTCGWKYVGKKADYVLAKTLENNHRSRVYMSYASSWNEVGTEGLSSFPYTGHVIQDGANRRTAGSVRCVKDVNIGTIRSQITSDKRDYIKGETVRLVMSASTPSSSDSRFALKEVELYYYVGADETADPEWTLMDDAFDGQEMVAGKYSWVTEPSINISLASLLDNDAEHCHVAFRLVVSNNSGLELSKTYSINYYPVDINVTSGGNDLSGMPVYWHTSYNVNVSVEGMSSIEGLTTIEIEGKSYEYNSDVSSYDYTGLYLDREFSVVFKDRLGNVLLERFITLDYTALAKSEKYSEGNSTTNQGGSVSEGLVNEAYYIITSRDDKSRHLRIQDGGTAEVSRDNPSAYGVFKLVDLQNGSYSSYSNVKAGKLQHLATGKYLARSGMYISLVEGQGSADLFYFCSDWGSEAVDNLDIVVKDGYSYYYMDAPNYAYVRLSTSGREHYKWYVQRVTNAPAN